MVPDSENPDRPGGDPSVFGNLPSARPGVRSPRRDAGKSESAKPKRAPRKAKASAASKPKPASPRRPVPGTAPPPPSGPSSTPPAEQEEGSSRGIEDVAWAGITVAAEAATLGVRLVSRAMEAVRERR